MRFCLCIIFTFCLFTEGCHSPTSARRKKEIKEDILKLPDTELEGFVYRFYKGKEKRWELKADKAVTFQNQELVRVKGVYLSIYEHGELSSELYSRYGKVTNKGKLLVAISNVLLQTKDGDKLETTILYWNDDTQKLYTDQKVKITWANGNVIEGRGFIADPSLQKIEIESGVKGRIYETR